MKANKMLDEAKLTSRLIEDVSSLLSRLFAVCNFWDRFLTESARTDRLVF